MVNRSVLDSHRSTDLKDFHLYMFIYKGYSRCRVGGKWLYSHEFLDYYELATLGVLGPVSFHWRSAICGCCSFLSCRRATVRVPIGAGGLHSLIFRNIAKRF